MTAAYAYRVIIVLPRCECIKKEYLTFCRDNKYMNGQCEAEEDTLYKCLCYWSVCATHTHTHTVSPPHTHTHTHTHTLCPTHTHTHTHHTPHTHTHTHTHTAPAY